MTKNELMEQAVLNGVPKQINDSEILDFLYTKDVNWIYVNTIKRLTDYNDVIISDWLNLSVKTLREYRKPESTFKDNVKEHVLLLLTFFKHGNAVFESQQLFDNWLDTPNFYFDNKKPSTFLNTVTGIKFVNDRLTAMEYGDNI